MRRDGGFTLAAILVPTFALALGPVVVPTGFQAGTSGVDTGNTESTAACLTEERFEQLKALALTIWMDAALDARATPELYGTIADAGAYRPVTPITDARGG